LHIGTGLLSLGVGLLALTVAPELGAVALAAAVANAGVGAVLYFQGKESKGSFILDLAGVALSGVSTAAAGAGVAAGSLADTAAADQAGTDAERVTVPWWRVLHGANLLYQSTAAGIRAGLWGAASTTLGGASSVLGAGSIGGGIAGLTGGSGSGGGSYCQG
jgi:hypothetical protein